MRSQTIQTIQFGRSQVLRFGTVQEGLNILGNSAPSGRQNLEARVGNSSLFGRWMDSKDISLYGGMNDDQRYRFKEDFSFNLPFIASADVNADGSVSIDNTRYTQSQGTEFILIGKEELTGTTDVYAISSKRYDIVKSVLNTVRSSGQRFSVDKLVKAGGFKVNADLTVDEHIKLKDGRSVLDLKKEDITRLSLEDFEYIHAGWHEHFIGSNNVTPKQYLKGAKLYVKYLQEANKNNCFPKGKGMGFFLETGVRDYKARSWCVVSSRHRSRADVRVLYSCGHFLKVRDTVAAEGDEQKIMPYEDALNEADKIAPKGTPFNPIIVGLVNKLYNRQ